MNVIDATAEALPLELLNKTNKELTAQLSHYEELVDDKSRGIEDQRKRLQFMKEHLGNVRAEIVNTQSLVESKNRELESENHISRIIERECGRLRQRLTHLSRAEEETQGHLMALQNRIFQDNLKMEEFKAAMDFNQEELEQWDEARRQKEEDELAIAQYTKQDEAKIRQLTLTMQRLEDVVRDKRKQLDDEILAVHNVQAELDRCAADYRKLHDDRSGLLDEWEQVVRAINERDNAIRVAAEQYAEGVDWLQRRQTMKKELDSQLQLLTDETDMINFNIKDHEKRAQQLRDVVPALTRQVQDVGDEVDALRGEVSRMSQRKATLVSRLRESEGAVIRKERELDAVQKRRDAATERLKNEMAAADDMQKQTALINQILKDAERSDKQLEKDIEQLKKTQFQANEELRRVRELQSEYLAEISGAQARGKNFNAKISQLDGESFMQQEVLYNIEFSVQQMEKKVNRSKGERTEEERKELHEKIDLLQGTLDELEQQHRMLDAQVKHVREELRRSRVETEKVEATRRRTEEHVLELQLECTYSDEEAKRLERKKEDDLVQLDTMELQLSRLRRLMRQRSNELMDMSERKKQLAADISEREAEIAVHHDMLRMEAKLAEDERKRLANELINRSKSAAAIKNRYQVLAGRMDPAQARLTQVELVVAAAKERESLQYRGDSLDVRIKRMEREILKLEKTIAIIKASNSTYRHKFDKATEDNEEVRTQRVLQEKYRELKAMMSRRALDTNDSQSTLQVKQGELEELSMRKEQVEGTLRDMQQEYEQIGQGVLQTREAAARFDQAISKARSLVDQAVARDITLAESKERLQRAVNRLLQCSQRLGQDVHATVHGMILEAHLPVGEV